MGRGLREASPRLMKLSTAAFLLGLASGLGCTVDVVVDLSTCHQNGESWDAGETFLAPDGCNSCACGEDGNITCTKTACFGGCIAPDGSERQPGETFTIDCNTCVCDPGTLTVSCDTKMCTPCDQAPPPDSCPPPMDPLCSTVWSCDPTTGWYCEILCQTCVGDPPICEAPMGCFWDGPTCDELGNWTCGNLNCDMCAAPAPDCGPGFVPVCDPNMGWTCYPTCVDPIPDCPPPADPVNCFVHADCHGDGTWTCQEDCPNLCMGGPPPCELGPPNCTEYAVCTTMGWSCAESCL